ncbi:UNVERIFIED_ORG: cystine transport system permease protein [Peribacillus simplex]
MVRTQKSPKNGLVKMFLLSNIFSDPERMNQLVSIAQTSLYPMVEGAIKYTIPLTLITFVLGLILAVLTALARLSSIKILQIIARVYVSIIRGTPLLVQLFIIFYGLPNLGITLNPFISAIIGFSLSVGAYASEIIRAAILSIPKGQWEAGYSIGMTYTQALKRIVLPQAARVSIPPLSNTFISLLKDTSLASLILVAEMFRKAQEIAAKNYEFLLLYIEAGAIYWIMCTVLSIIQGRIEEKLNRYVAK